MIDHLFAEGKLDEVMKVLHRKPHWKTQKHTYSALYVDDKHWDNTSKDQRFVQRDAWQPDMQDSNIVNAVQRDSDTSQKFLSFLRSHEFMSLLSRIFKVKITDVNVADPEINTNYFRLSPTDFVEQHADDSPGREVCMLLYLNKNWNIKAGGELVFLGADDTPIAIAPRYNRCVLFDPSSIGSEHWVKKLTPEDADENQYRYNVTSWYWSE